MELSLWECIFGESKKSRRAREDEDRRKWRGLLAQNESYRSLSPESRKVYDKQLERQWDIQQGRSPDPATIPKPTSRYVGTGGRDDDYDSGWEPDPNDRYDNGPDSD
jgi:hypothetical protein